MILNPYPLDLIEIDFVTGAVIELGGFGRFVEGNGLGFFDRPAFFKVGGDPRGPESMAADAAGKASCNRPALDHVEGVIAPQRPIGKVPATAIG